MLVVVRNLNFFFIATSAGMMETVRIRRSGYPVRRTFEDFLFRYSVLGRVVGVSMVQEPKDKCAAILKKYDETTGSKDWQPGHTKVSQLCCCCCCCGRCCCVVVILMFVLVFVLVGVCFSCCLTCSSQIFYRENLERHLERQRMLELREVCKVIYGVILTVITRRRFIKTKARIVIVQKIVRVSAKVMCR